MSFVKLALFLTLAASLVLTTGCGQLKADKPAQNTGNANAGAPAAKDPGLIHVHGLGVNPKDDALYVATHTGMFRIPQQGRAERVGDRFQDTMGFTIVGPDHFLGSGHPDMRDYTSGKLPGLLGFLESRDAGRTWATKSLLGKADFHILAMAQGTIYGFDATGEKLMRSKDGKSWEQQSAVNLQSLAVNPANSEMLIAATARGTQTSRDGGRSWNAQAQASPLLVLVAWPAAGLVLGLDAQGRTFSSSDEGTTWSLRSQLEGRPEAFVATDKRLFAAVIEKGIYVSGDAGATWSLYYREPA